MPSQNNKPFQRYMHSLGYKHASGWFHADDVDGAMLKALTKEDVKKLRGQLESKRNE